MAKQTVDFRGGVEVGKIINIEANIKRRKVGVQSTGKEAWGIGVGTEAHGNKTWALLKVIQGAYEFEVCARWGEFATTGYMDDILFIGRKGKGTHKMEFKVRHGRSIALFLGPVIKIEWGFPFSSYFMVVRAKDGKVSPTIGMRHLYSASLIYCQVFVPECNPKYSSAYAAFNIWLSCADIDGNGGVRRKGIQQFEGRQWIHSIHRQWEMID
eukprot:15342986-Ditylum_brightwellii.AAC.1